MAAIYRLEPQYDFWEIQMEPVNNIHICIFNSYFVKYTHSIKN